MNKISKLFSLRNIARFSALSLLVSAFSTTDLAAMGANETNVLPVVNVAQQSKSVSGVVADKSGEPIIGANVVVKGANVGSITDFDGAFKIENVPSAAILQISYIGFKTQEIPVGSKSSFNITLEEDSETLDEVVVVGYGTQKKVNLTGSVSSVKFDEELANRPITDASQALSGKVSGVWISQNSGKPGDDGAQLRIRGGVH